MNGKFYKNIRKYIILAKGYILININTTSINFKKEIRTLFIPPKIWPLRLSLSIIGMITINSQEIRYFYRNIVKSGNVYRIKYNNKDYGEFKKLSDALYERDALFYCNFDYDLLVESVRRRGTDYGRSATGSNRDRRRFGRSVGIRRLFAPSEGRKREGTGRGGRRPGRMSAGRAETGTFRTPSIIHGTRISARRTATSRPFFRLRDWE